MINLKSTTLEYKYFHYDEDDNLLFEGEMIVVSNTHTSQKQMEKDALEHMNKNLEGDMIKIETISYKQKKLEKMNREELEDHSNLWKGDYSSDYRQEKLDKY